MDLQGLYFTETEIKKYLDALVISDEARKLSLVNSEREHQEFIERSIREFLYGD